MSPVLLAVLTAETVAAALVWVAFPIHYHVSTRGRWRGSAHGRVVFTLASVLALMIVFTLAGSVLPMVFLLWAALLLWPALALVGVRQHRLLWLDQRGRHESPKA